MEDIAKIGFRADSDELLVAEKRLDALDPAAKKAETASQRFERRMKQMGGVIGGVFGRMNTAMRTWADSAQRTFDRVGGIVKRGFDGMMNAARGWIGIAAGAFALTNVINTLSEFESTMSAVEAVSGATGDTLQSLRDTAVDLGSTTQFSASQAASGLQLLTMAGYSAEQAISTIPAVLNLAATEAMDLGQATGIVTSIMAGFGLGVADATRATDVLVYASNAADTSVSDLGEGMKYVAPVARAMGISVEETAAALGILSNAGIKGGQAGTSLRGVLASLAAPSGVAADAIASLGLTMDQINPASNSLQEIVDTLANSGLDAATAFRIFGAEGAPAILALTANNGALADLNAGLMDSAGTAERIAGIMSDNLKGSIDSATSAIEGFIIAIGDAGLTAVLRAFFDLAASLFGFLASNMMQLRGYIIAAALGFTVYMTPAIIAGGVAIYGMVAALVTLRTALISTGLGAFIVLAGFLINKIIEIVDAAESWNDAFNQVGVMAKGLFDGIIVMATALPSGLRAVWNLIKLGFAKMVFELSLMWAEFLFKIQLGLDNLGNAVGISMMGNVVQPAIDAASVLSTNIDETMSGLVDTVEENSTQASGIISQGWSIITQAWNTSTEVVNNLSDGIENNTEVVDDNTGAIDTNTGAMGGAAGAAGQMQTALQALGDEYGRLLDPINQATSAFNNLQQANELGVINDEQYTSGLTRIQEAFAATGGTAEQWARIMNGATDSVADKLEALGEKSISGLGDEIFNLAVEGEGNFKDLTKSIIKDLWNMAYQALIVKPLMSWFGFADGGTFGTSSPATVELAKGGTFYGGQLQEFAQGGTFTNAVVNAPTPFKFAQGGGFGLGVMGEAGPEAVMPLTRGPDGSLGVQMYTAASQTAATATAAQQAATPAQVTIAVVEGQMFRAEVQEISGDVAVAVVQRAQPEIVQNSVASTRKQMNKSKSGWGI